MWVFVIVIWVIWFGCLIEVVIICVFNWWILNNLVILVINSILFLEILFKCFKNGEIYVVFVWVVKSVWFIVKISVMFVFIFFLVR